MARQKKNLQEYTDIPKKNFKTNEKTENIAWMKEKI
jgi:hypothetical protein